MTINNHRAMTEIRCLVFVVLPSVRFHVTNKNFVFVLDFQYLCFLVPPSFFRSFFSNINFSIHSIGQWHVDFQANMQSARKDVSARELDFFRLIYWRSRYTMSFQWSYSISGCQGQDLRTKNRTQS